MNPSEQIPEGTAKPPRKRRHWRWLLGGLAVAMFIAFGILWFVLGHVGTPAVKSRIVNAAASFGIPLDFDSASVSTGGLHIAGLKVSQPMGRLGPPLVLIDHIDADFSPWAALNGGRATLHNLAIKGVHLALFMSDDDTNSVTQLVKGMPPSPPKTATPSKPLSQTLAHLGDLPVTIESFKIEDVDATMVKVVAGQNVETTKFTGLELTVSAKDGLLDARLATAPASAQLDIDDRGSHKGGKADVSLHFTWNSRGAPRGDVTIEAKLRRQDLVALPSHAPSVEQLLSMKASVVPHADKYLTTVVVENLSLLGGAGTGNLDADLIDDGAGGVKPLIRSASLDLMLDGLRGFLPDEFGTIEALSGRVMARATGIDLSSGIKVAADGGASVQADIGNLVWRNNDSAVQLSRTRLEFGARPKDDGAEFEARIPIEHVKANLPGQFVALANANVKAAGTITSNFHISGHVTAAMEGLHFKAAQDISIADGEVRVTAKDLDVHDKGPLHATGEIESEVSAGRIDAKTKDAAVGIDELKVNVPARLNHDGSGSVDAHVEAAHVTVDRSGKSIVGPTPFNADVHVPHFAFDAKTPARSTAEAKVDLTFGEFTAHVETDKRARDIDFNVSANTKSLDQVRPFIGGKLPIPWEKIGLAFASKGSVSKLDEPNLMQISHETTLDVTRGAFHGDSFDVGADAMSVKLASHGTMKQHDLDATVHLAGLTIQGDKRPGEENLKLHAAIDRAQPKADVKFEAAGEACPEGHLNANFGFDRQHARITYTADGDLKRLDLIPELLPKSITEHHEIDWSKLRFSLKASGNADGVVTSFKDLKPTVAANPMKVIRGAQSVDLEVNDLNYSDDDDQSVEFDSAQIHLDATETDAGKHVDVRSKLSSGEFDAAGVDVKFENLSPVLSVDLAEKSLAAHIAMGIASLSQDAYAAYPVGDASLDVLLSAGADGTLHIESAKLDNPAGGTTLTAKGDIESLLVFADGMPKMRPASTNAARHGATLSGDVSQRLERVPASTGVTGRGVCKIPFAVETTDLKFVSVKTGIEFQNADVDLVSRRTSIAKLNARIPIKLSFRLDDAGTKLLGGAHPGVYSRERFVDYQPFLGTQDFVTCESIRVGDQIVGPVAGNLRIDRNLIALDQVEMSAYGGKITGQIIVEMDPEARELTDVQFRGNVTGLAPEHDHVRSSEVVDANAALRFNPKRLELEGRIDIVSIGRDDLRGMLDAWDPYHADASANRARSALSVGYPKDVRLGFREGFTDIKVEMGGLAGAAGIAPIQVSTGPLLEKYVTPYMKLLKPKAKP